MATGQLHPVRQALLGLMSFHIAAQCKRLIVEVTAEPKQTFWNYTAGILTDRATIEWCKVFGSRNEETHWRNAVPTADQTGVFAELLQATGLDEAGWTAYQSSLLDYRNMVAAHTDLDAPNVVTNFPHFDVALLAAEYMFDVLYGMLSDDEKGGLNSSLVRWSRSYVGGMRPIVAAAFAGSRSLGSNVS